MLYIPNLSGSLNKDLKRKRFFGKNLNLLSLPSYPPAPTPTYFWQLEESGGARASSQGTADLNVLSGTPGSGTGKIGNCVTFNSDSLLSNSTELNTGTTFTFAGWFLINSLATNQQIVCRDNEFGTPTTREWSLFHTAGDITFNYFIGGGANITTPIPILVSTWYFFAFGSNGTDSTFRLNNSTELFGGPIDNGAAIPTTFGGQNNDGGGANLVDGKIDAVGYWDTYLSDSDLNFLQNNGTGKEWNGSSWI